MVEKVAFYWHSPSSPSAELQRRREIEIDFLQRFPPAWIAKKKYGNWYFACAFIQVRSAGFVPFVILVIHFRGRLKTGWANKKDAKNKHTTFLPAVACLWRSTNTRNRMEMTFAKLKCVLSIWEHNVWKLKTWLAAASASPWAHLR